MNKILRTFKTNSFLAFEETGYPDLCYMLVHVQGQAEPARIPLNRSDLETMVHLFRNYASDGNHIKFSE
jgi:hypothetical protein